jgi:hypothetical protein
MTPTLRKSVRQSVRDSVPLSLRNSLRNSRRNSLHRHVVALALLLSVRGATTAHAQPRAQGPLVLRLPASARIASLANAGITSFDGDGLFYNPGMIASSRGFAASMQSYGSNGIAGALGTTTTSGTNTIGVGAQFVRYGAARGASYADVVQPGGTHLSDKGDVAASSTAITLGVARTVFGLRLGASVKYVEDHIGAEQDGTVAVDVGMNRPTGPGTLGVVIQNIGVGPRIDGIKGRLPARVGVGYGGSTSISPIFDLGAQMALTLEGGWFVRPAGGTELSYVPIDGVQITLREGIRLPREKDESLITAGLGLTIDRFSLDYAMEPMRGGRPVSHRIGIRLR